MKTLYRVEYYDKMAGIKRNSLFETFTQAKIKADMLKSECMSEFYNSVKLFEYQDENETLLEGC